MRGGCAFIPPVHTIYGGLPVPTHLSDYHHFQALAIVLRASSVYTIQLHNYILYGTTIYNNVCVVSSSKVVIAVGAQSGSPSELQGPL